MDLAFLSTTFWRLMGALPLTLEVWALSVAIGCVIAMGLTWMRVSGSKILEAISRAYVFVFRGSPLLIQLFLIYYGLSTFAALRASFLWPFFRDAFNCAVLSLALCTAAYSSEIFRGALAGVPHGQIEATALAAWCPTLAGVLGPEGVQLRVASDSTDPWALVPPAGL